MPWEGIEDVSSKVPLTWLSREKETDNWSPLRKCDCLALNKAYSHDRSKTSKVLIESKRATADLENLTIGYNFYDMPTRQLCTATWFLIKCSNPKSLLPIVLEDANKIEMLYQKALEATRSFGKGIQTLLSEEVILSDDENKYKAVISSSAATYSIRRRCVSKFSLNFNENLLFQRGYGYYEVDGEIEETSLGDVSHVIFVIHGIGEALWSRSDSTFSLVEEINLLRSAIHAKQYESYKKACQLAESRSQGKPLPPNRIELLPIQWYDSLHGPKSCMKKSLKSVTLETIPSMRNIVNDVLMDVLMYLTPIWQTQTLEFISGKLKSLLDSFQKIHVTVDKYSLIGHSLGSIIIWDLLSAMKDEGATSKFTGLSPSLCLGNISSMFSKESSNTKKITSGPSLLRPIEKPLPFHPEFVLFLGSPIGLFLSLRGSNFSNTMNIKEESENQYSLSSLFAMPCKSLYNVFHPTDPVAYRIEPLLLPPDVTGFDLPQPCYLETEDGGSSLHTKMVKFGASLQKSLKSLPVLQNQDDACNEKKRSQMEIKNLYFALGGESRGGRVDFQIQQGLIGNNYVSSLLAHTCYFRTEDVINFIIELASSD